MAIHRHGETTWEGGTKGRGRLSTGSGALDGQGFAFPTRFGTEAGTNPEELLAAAHAGCLAMSLAKTLETAGYQPGRIDVRAQCVLAQAVKGWEIEQMRIEVRAEVPDIAPDTFQELVGKAANGCLVSNAIRGNVDIDLEATLAT
jgi:osmotically inducible protein OsmC